MTMGHKSATRKAIESSRPKGIQPPDDFDGPARLRFIDLVASLPPERFIDSDAPLLVEYCRLLDSLDTWHYDWAAMGKPWLDQSGKVHPMLAARKGMVDDISRLATALRLRPASRYTGFKSSMSENQPKKKAGRKMFEA